MTGESAPNPVVMTVHSARDLKAVRDSFAWLPVAGDVLADVVLAASEVVTNALQYAGAPCQLRVVFPTSSGAVRVEVRDTDPGTIVFRRVPIRPDATRGRGLRIIDALVSRWGVDDVAKDGKTVWFEVDPRG